MFMDKRHKLFLVLAAVFITCFVVGDIIGGTGLVVALGLSLGAMLHLSGAAAALARAALGLTGVRAAPWATYSPGDGTATGTSNTCAATAATAGLRAAPPTSSTRSVATPRLRIASSPVARPASMPSTAAPTAAPMIALSAKGVSSTRSGPNSS